MRTKKSQKGYFKNNNDNDISDFEYHSLLRSWAVSRKKQEPLIPYDQPIRIYQYECIKEGSTGSPEQCWFVLGEIYNVRKNRRTNDFVSINGVIHNRNTGLTFLHQSWMSVPLKNCKEFLKQVK